MPIEIISLTSQEYRIFVKQPRTIRRPTEDIALHNVMIGNVANEFEIDDFDTVSSSDHTLTVKTTMRTRDNRPRYLQIADLLDDKGRGFGLMPNGTLDMYCTKPLQILAWFHSVKTLPFVPSAKDITRAIEYKKGKHATIKRENPHEQIETKKAA